MVEDVKQECESEVMTRMCLIDTLREIPHFKEKPEVGVKSLASGPQSAIQFIHHTDTLKLIY